MSVLCDSRILSALLVDVYACIDCSMAAMSTNHLLTYLQTMFPAVVRGNTFVTDFVNHPDDSCSNKS